MQITDQQDNKISETVVKPSRASPLPQGNAIQCGSGLAREEARKANKSASLEPVAIHWCAKV
ncbi:hypothetical protein FQ187_27580 [Pseudomonas sp. ANT_J28]|nr:hypothetical protein FQ187_27580 [Pseudomonas sp. ANT_J28]